MTQSLLCPDEGTSQLPEASMPYCRGIRFANCLGWNFKGMNLCDHWEREQRNLTVAGSQPNVEGKVICLKNVRRATEVPRVGTCQLKECEWDLWDWPGWQGHSHHLAGDNLQIGVWQDSQGSSELMDGSWNCVLCCRLFCCDFNS